MLCTSLGSSDRALWRRRTAALGSTSRYGQFAGASFLVDGLADDGRKRDWSAVPVDEGILHEGLVG
jgi:hypothetical protein